MTLPIPAPRADGFTTTTPVPLYWREDGPIDAPTIVLLHGGPGASHDYLYPQMLALAESHRVITYDQRGGGRSRPPNADVITWRTQVQDLAAVIRELVPRASASASASAVTTPPPVLAGYSWGALLAMLYAIEQTRHDSTAAALPAIDRLLLVSPAPITTEWRAEFDAALAARQMGPEIRALREQLAASGLRETDLPAFRQRSFELSVAGYFADAHRAESLTPFRVTARVQQSVWESLGTFDLRDELRAVSLPVLVVHGRQDPIPMESAVAVSEALKGRLVVLEACGHVPYVEQPEGLFNAAQRFLA